MNRSVSIILKAAAALCVSPLAALLASQEAGAQDACVSELRRLDDLDMANQKYKTPSGVCVFMRNQIKLETDYAAFYRSCGNGMDAEIEAHKHEKSASGLQIGLASNCVGGRTKDLSDLLR
jgi:CubicO group peptidase (beta-lactamase class C family)